MKKFSRKLLSVLLIIAMLIPTGMMSVTSSAADVSIPDDAVMFNGRYYKAYDISKSWTDAKAYCENLGGHLVTITSQSEQTFIEEQFLTDNPKKDFYLIGGYRIDYNSSEWFWITDEAFSYSKWGGNGWEGAQPIQNQLYIWLASSTYYHSSHEPFSWISHQNSNYTDSVWNTNKAGFICEWEPEVYTIAGRTFDKNIDYYTAKCSSSSYNVELANMTAALSKAVYSSSDITSAYNSLGFNEIGFYDYDGAFDPNSCGYVIDFKQSAYNNDTICLVAVRGSSNTSDWIGNFNIDTSIEGGKHIGFYYPAKRIYSKIQSLIQEKGLSGNIKYVITGHSRGAAVANLLAVELMEKGVSLANIYNYNFACPDVACKVMFSNYSNIFNLCNREDPVPFVPGHLASAFTTSGTSWGKYGQTYWFTKDADDTISPFADHNSNLYLEFFDQQLNPSEWGKSFSDKVDDVTYWVTGWVTKIMCPVDVVITDTDGNKIASVIGGEVNYYDSNFGDVIIFTDGDKKIIYINGDKNFNVELVGTDDGTMTYSVEKYNLMTEEVLESKTFENVKLEEGKMMNSPVFQAATTNDVELFVVNEQKKITHTVNTDGSEEIYTKDCSHLCHNDNAFMQFIWKIINFLSKIFGASEHCDCGMKHW